MNAWQVSKSLHCRPSEVYGIADGFSAYCFDSAVVRWGAEFDNAIQAATGGAKTQAEAERAAQRVLRKWVPSTRVYRDQKG
jgi:N-acetylneuraminic acid mutarotase